MHIEFLAHKSVDLSVGMSIPRHIANVLSPQHVARADAVPTTRASLATLDLVRSVLVLLKWGGRIKGTPRSTWSIATWACGVHIVLSRSISVVNAALVLRCRHQPGIVDPIVVAKVVESNVVHGVEAFLGNQLHDAVAAAVNGIVLELHDSPSAESLVVPQVSSKARHRGNHDDDLVLLTSTGSTQDTFHNGGANLVLHWALRVTRCCNEKLVLDVHKMVAVLDHSSISIGNRVFQRASIAPLGTAAHNLA